MGSILEWVKLATGDAAVLVRGYLPEILVVTVVVLLSWAVKAVFSRDARSSL